MDYAKESERLHEQWKEELSADYIIPKAFDRRVGPAVAKAVAEAARATGAARR